MNPNKLYQKDFQILKEHHKFLRDDEKDSQIKFQNPSQEEYGEILAKKYYEKLFKEYAIVDLSRYETGQIGMRWQTKEEVIIGKGINKCANKVCNNVQNLSSYEVNFAYTEDNERKNALVKVRVCEDCVVKLNFKNQHNKVEEDLIPNPVDIIHQKSKSHHSQEKEKESSEEEMNIGKQEKKKEKKSKKDKSSKKEKKIKKVKKSKKHKSNKTSKTEKQ